MTEPKGKDKAKEDARARALRENLQKRKAFVKSQRTDNHQTKSKVEEQDAKS